MKKQNRQQRGLYAALDRGPLSIPPRKDTLSDGMANYGGINGGIIATRVVPSDSSGMAGCNIIELHAMASLPAPPGLRHSPRLPNARETD